jgi:predicted amidophosphoribosyltransferase
LVYYEQVNCPRCGTDLSPTAKRCPKCSRPVGSAEPPPAAKKDPEGSYVHFPDEFWADFVAQLQDESEAD